MLRPRKEAAATRFVLTSVLLTAVATPLIGCGGSNIGMRGAQAGQDASVLDFFGNQQTATSAIEDALNEFDADRRRSGLARIAAEPWGGEPAYVDFYRLAIQDDDAAVRSVAARALALHGEREDAIAVAKILTDDDRLVRWSAARALQRLHNEQVVDALIRRTMPEVEDDVLVREAAARALGQYAQSRVLQALVSALDDPDLAVNAGAKSSLQVLTGERLGYAPEKWSRWISATNQPFAGRLEYTFPAFERDARWFEVVNPWYEVPNETGSRPVGMPPSAFNGSGA